MNEDFPPRQFAKPMVRVKSKGKGHIAPLPAEVLARRTEIARVLGVKVDGINQHLKSLTDEQRKAVFYKVTHDGPVDLTGTGLKALVDRSENVTLAIPKSNHLDKFAEKVQQFAKSVPRNGMVDNQSFVNIEDI